MIENERDVRLRELLDKQEIYERLVEYCRGADSADGSRIASIFSEESYVDQGNYFRGSGRELGTVIAFSAGRPPTTTHFLGNLWCVIEGDIAYSESYYLGVVYLPKHADSGNDATVEMRAYRFLDRWRREEGGWKILRRKVVRDHGWVMREVPSADPQAANLGVRSQADPSYRIREMTDPANAGTAEQYVMGFAPAAVILDCERAELDALIEQGELTSVVVPDLGIEMIVTADVMSRRAAGSATAAAE